MYQNEMRLEFESRSCNESFARVTVAAFMTQLNPTLEEVADVKTAVSEAVTNAIIHGYEGKVNKIVIVGRIREEMLEVEVHDNGRGILDVKRAMEPLFTTKAECDRAGMGFSFMEAFMDTLEVESAPGQGTCVRMSKRIARAQSPETEPLVRIE
ncbi:MAG: anti-sigma F factor [Lachnospiraceae bacterium]|nr:anti-sigma F factor [Lachnospiraceae bacterium]